MGNCLQSAYVDNKGIVIMGDFNIDTLKSSPLKGRWSELYDHFRLVQIISEPTRVTSTTETLIDHIYVSDDIPVVYTGVVKYGLSDHSPVLTVINTKNNQYNELRSSHFEIRYRNLKNFNTEALHCDLVNTEWPDCSL